MKKTTPPCVSVMMLEITSKGPGIDYWRWQFFFPNSKYLNALFNSLILFIIHIRVLMCMLIAKDLFSLYYFAFSPFIIFFPARFV